MRGQRVTDELVDQWISVYEAGYTISDIAQISGHAESTVYQRFKKSSVQMRPTYGPFKMRYRQSKGKYVHRVVAAVALGRPLTKKEVVHHVDNNKTNNKPKNLWVFPHQSAHAKYHKTGAIHNDTIKLGE